MDFKAYKLSYYLNATHSMDRDLNNAHGHTFTITLYIHDLSKKGFLDFSGINNMFHPYLDQLSGKYLNDLDIFQELLPTIENIASVVYETLKKIMMNEEYDLIQIDICENPLRVYSISDRLYLGTKPMEAI